jgi:hypothetical protein
MYPRRNFLCKCRFLLPLPFSRNMKDIEKRGKSLAILKTEQERFVQPHIPTSQRVGTKPQRFEFIVYYFFCAKEKGKFSGRLSDFGFNRHKKSKVLVRKFLGQTIGVDYA